MITRRLHPLLLLLATAVSGPTARACPVCDSPRATEVRSALVDDVTPRTLAAVGLPFVVVAGVVSLVHFGVPDLRRRR